MDRYSSVPPLLGYPNKDTQRYGLAELVASGLHGYYHMVAWLPALTPTTLRVGKVPVLLSSLCIACEAGGWLWLPWKLESLIVGQGIFSFLLVPVSLVAMELDLLIPCSLFLFAPWWS